VRRGRKAAGLKIDVRWPSCRRLSLWEARLFNCVKHRKEGKVMYDLSFKELAALAILLIPLVLLIAGIAMVFIYATYVVIRDRFSNTFHLRHRKAH
jgi:hypothetical protein